MAIVKVKPTSPGRRAMVKVVNKNLHKGEPYAPLLDSKARKPAVTTTATSPRAIRAVVTSSTIVSSISVARRMASPAKVERLEYDPNRSANIALVLLRRRRTPLHHRPEGHDRRPAADVGLGSADQCRQHAADPQHSGRYDDPLHRNAAGQGRANRALGWHVGACCWLVKASTRRFVCARAKCVACTSNAVQRSVKLATKSIACARSARLARIAGAVSARRCVALR